MITKPENLKFDGRKLSVIVAGVPGIGKTTLACSAPKPLLIDVDNGVFRVEAKYRVDTMSCGTYAQLREELANADLSAYETIVIDTGGKLLEMMKPTVIAKDPKNGKRDGSLSLQGYGAVKREFASFMSLVKGMGKNIVVVFHATEVSTGDDSTTGLRIRVEGSTRDDVWDDVDIGGFVEMRGKKRTIGFTNCERYYAKGTHGVHGVYEIPDLSSGCKNDFLARLFDKIKESINGETEEFARYSAIMSSLLPEINGAKDAESLNAAYADVAKSSHALTSKDELWSALNEKAKAMGVSYDKGSNSFR